ncbi:MAG: hypothetical protein JWP63_6592 [Candidatus Solibacter sp.]|nr:hypothetical protein [Candidatus Solibacter sp.]
MSDLLRHTVATLAYRANKALAGAPPEFASYNGAGRTPGEILAHLCDLFDWALHLAEGQSVWRDSTPQPWEADVERFFAVLQTFDQRLASDVPLKETPERLFQGPIADALTHVGQIAMLRRMAGCKIPGESYFVAKVETGRCGADQAAPVKEF